MRIDTRPVTRRRFCLAFLGTFAGLRFAASRFTSIVGTEFEHLFRWCSFDGPRFAGAS